MRRLLIAHCLSSYSILAGFWAVGWLDGSLPPTDQRVLAMSIAAPVWIPLDCTLGLWNDHGIRWHNVKPGCGHLLLTGGFVLALRWAHARRLRRPAGRCPTCGYDLRATPSRCPECGTVPAETAAE